MKESAGKVNCARLFRMAVLLAAIVAAGSPARADEHDGSAVKPETETSNPAGETPKTEPQEAPPSGPLDAGHAEASAGVRELGSWLDRLFADEDYEAEVNESRLRLRLDSFTEQYEGIGARIRARLYLKLPGLGDRVRAEILSASEPQDVEGADVAAAGPSAGPGEDDQRDIAAAVSYFFRNDEDRSLSARIGLKFDRYTPDPFVGARYRKHISLDDDWNFRFVERIRFYSLEGFESVSSFSFDRALERDRLFRTGLSGTWLHEEEDFNYSLGFALFEPLNEKAAVEYQLVNSFATNPHSLQEVALRFRYRRQVWREWLVFEVAPQASFPRDRNYEPVPGILFRLEATFGGEG